MWVVNGFRCAHRYQMRVALARRAATVHDTTFSPDSRSSAIDLSCEVFNYSEQHPRIAVGSD
jgi:hypothetical protein